MEKLFFVADCHLDGDEPHGIQLFRRFLCEHAPGGNALYILGDLFDHWIGDDMPPGKLGPVVDDLRELGRQIPVYFIHGNRDFLIGKKFAATSGCRILDEISVINIQKKRTLLMHGDLLCTDDISYQRYRKIIRSQLLLSGFKRLPLHTRMLIARYLRRTSRQKTGSKRTKIMDTNPDTVASYAHRFKVDQIIHGHTHKPAIHEESSGQFSWRRIVLGDWYEKGNYLVVENGTPEMKSL